MFLICIEINAHVYKTVSKEHYVVVSASVPDPTFVKDLWFSLFPVAPTVQTNIFYSYFLITVYNVVLFLLNMVLKTIHS
jgi:hypothetical protein